MRITRFLAGSAAAALLAALPVLSTAPAAQAAPTHASQIQYDAQAKSLYLYKQTIAIKGRVLIEGLGECAGGSTYCRPPDTTTGQVVLQRQFKGSATWSTIASRADESLDFSFATTAWQNSTFRVVYTGGSFDNGSVHNFSATQKDRPIKVGRNPAGKVVKSSGRLYFRGNVDPGFAQRWVTIQKKTCQSCSWRTFASVKTNSNGGYSTRVSAPRTGRWYWRSYVPGTDPTFAGSYSSVWFTFTE
jgi:hypothetical protein